MSDEREDMLRRLGTSGVPVTSAELLEARRERVVSAIGRAIRGSAVRRERGQRLRQLGAGLLVAAGIALAVFVARDANRTGAAASASHARSVPRLRSAAGSVQISHEGKLIGAKPGTLLALGDRVKTALKARAELETEKSRVVLYENGELALARAGEVEERIWLGVGHVDVAVDKHVEPARAVIVETPDAEIVVRGTRFDVEVEPATGSATTVTNVSVVHGTVSILQRGTLVASLTAGQHWTSRRLPGPGPDAEATSAPAARAQRTAPPALLKEVAAPEGAGTLAEENRLFQEALETRNRGEHARAVELFGRLLGRYPRSPLAEEAQAERFRGLRRLKLTARAAAEARRYLAQHPSGFAAAEARELALEPTSGP